METVEAEKAYLEKMVAQIRNHSLIPSRDDGLVLYELDEHKNPIFRKMFHFLEHYNGGIFEYEAVYVKVDDITASDVALSQITYDDMFGKPGEPRGFNAFRAEQQQQIQDFDNCYMDIVSQEDDCVTEEQILNYQKEIGLITEEEFLKRKQDEGATQQTQEQKQNDLPKVVTIKPELMNANVVYSNPLNTGYRIWNVDMQKLTTLCRLKHIDIFDPKLGCGYKTTLSLDDGNFELTVVSTGEIIRLGSIRNEDCLKIMQLVFNKRCFGKELKQEAIFRAIGKDSATSSQSIGKIFNGGVVKNYLAPFITVSRHSIKVKHQAWLSQEELKNLREHSNKN